MISYFIKSLLENSKNILIFLFIAFFSTRIKILNSKFELLMRY